MNWWQGLKTRVRPNVPLKDHTSFKIGGPADYFAEPKDARELKLLLEAAKKYGIPVYLLGAGSNLLVADKGIRGLAVRLNAPAFRKVSVKGNLILSSCGLSLGCLLSLAKRRNLGGLEFLAGIPGSVGGALAMNAGAFGSNIGDLVEKVKVMDYNGNIRTLAKPEIKFGYRSSGLARYIILEASFRLARRKAAQIRQAIKERLDYRRQVQDLSFPSAGCFFKNPPRMSAGKMIELCGLKRKSLGGACISGVHANFILNKAQATANDVLGLMQLAQRAVKKRFAVELEPEVKIWR